MEGRQKLLESKSTPQEALIALINQEVRCAGFRAQAGKAVSGLLTLSGIAGLAYGCGNTVKNLLQNIIPDQASLRDTLVNGVCAPIMWNIICNPYNGCNVEGTLEQCNPDAMVACQLDPNASYGGASCQVCYPLCEALASAINSETNNILISCGWGTAALVASCISFGYAKPVASTISSYFNLLDKNYTQLSASTIAEIAKFIPGSLGDTTVRGVLARLALSVQQNNQARNPYGLHAPAAAAVVIDVKKPTAGAPSLNPI